MRLVPIKPAPPVTNIFIVVAFHILFYSIFFQKNNTQ
jgi:hypothetical protein